LITRYSRHREAILEFLLHSKDHPTAETVYEHIRRFIPGISLGTVYRNLAFLADTGKIIRIRSRDDTLRFDARTREHYHWQCRICGKVGDLDIKIEPRLNFEAESQSGIIIERHDLCFIGVCRDCAETDAAPDGDKINGKTVSPVLHV
jgi:Fur family peroxide stress response transcriptional regulator